MTSDDLRATIARLRALLDKASLGPWEIDGDSPAHIVVLNDETGSIAGHIAEAGRDDAELIAALRNAAQDLLNAAERALTARNAALEEAAQKAEGFIIARSFCLTIASAIRALKEPT